MDHLKYHMMTVQIISGGFLLMDSMILFDLFALEFAKLFDRFALQILEGYKHFSMTLFQLKNFY